MFSSHPNYSKQFFRNLKLYYGDNLDILRLPKSDQNCIPDESVDLIYLDPPFKSNQDYNVLFEERNGTASRAQIKAFEDTWRWDEAAARAYEEVVEAGGKVSQALQAFRTYLGENDMMAYLSMMAPRLIELRRVLKPTGSIYLHCDPTASHYLKMLMDAIYGLDNFQREIIWRIGWVSGYKTKVKNWIRNHDVILFYTKRLDFTFNKIYVPYPKGYVRRDGKKPTGAGIPIEDVWGLSHEEGLTSVMIMSFSSEKLGYPTQKPVALLERIIQASSNEGDVILDPFCGCGTTVAAAQKLNRRWIGIDVTHLAIALIKNRLKEAYKLEEKKDYVVIGEPADVSGAQTLASQDPWQFQCWALGKVGARPVEVKKGADQGVDGRLYFHDEPNGKTKQIILSVKSGHTGVAHVRDLRGVMEREKAEMGVLITMEESTQPMRKEASSAGFYKSVWKHHPRIQILTLTEILEGAGIDYPHLTNVTMPKAVREASVAYPSPLPMEEK